MTTMNRISIIKDLKPGSKALMVGCILMLTACGQKGDLYIPEPKETAASVSETKDVVNKKTQRKPQP